jgi:hypothetical protein
MHPSEESRLLNSLPNTSEKDIMADALNNAFSATKMFASAPSNTAEKLRDGYFDLLFKALSKLDDKLLTALAEATATLQASCTLEEKNRSTQRNLLTEMKKAKVNINTDKDQDTNNLVVSTVDS